MTASRMAQLLAGVEEVADVGAASGGWQVGQSHSASIGQNCPARTSALLMLTNALPGEQVAVAGIAAGHDAVEQVDRRGRPPR